MSNNNLKLWKAVEETAPSGTKKANLGGREVTSINGAYMVKRATEMFGPLGIGWGYTISEEQFKDGAMYYSRGDKDGKGREPLGHEVMHTIRLTLWYELDGKRGEVTHFGHTPYIMGTKFGLMTDMDAPKKSMTDAIKKCLSMLGFSADIFLGQYDDPLYVEQQQTKEQIATAENAQDELADQRQEFMEWVEKELKAYALIPNPVTLQLAHERHNAKILSRCHSLNVSPDKVVNRFNQKYRDRLEELRPPEKLVCTECGTEGTGKPGSACPDCGAARNPN